MGRRIYISGPMSGKHLWNWPEFERAERELKADGWDPVSPARVDEDEGLVRVYRVPGYFNDEIVTRVVVPEDFDFREAIARDLWLIDGCQAIYMLRGWEDSLGARIELDRALVLGHEVLLEGGAATPAEVYVHCSPGGPDLSVNVAFATDRDERPWEPLPLNHFTQLKFVGDDDPVVDDQTNPKDLIGVTKPQVHLVPPAATVRMAEVMALGAAKYGAYNWREKAVRSTVYVSAAFRHLMAYLDGETIDPESGQPHTAHVAACMAILLDAADHGNLIDDRPTPGPAGDLIRELTAP